MILLRKLCLLLLAVAAIWLGFWVVFDNPDPVSFKLFGFDLWSLPSGLWLLSFFAVGCFSGVLFSAPAVIRLKRRARVLKKQLDKHKASEIHKHSSSTID